MALLMQDFGTYNGLHIWVELEDDSLRVNDQTRLILFVKNEKKGLVTNNVQIRLSVKPKGPAIILDLIKIKSILPGRTVREILPLNVGESKKGNYALILRVHFHLVPATWELDALPFQVQ